MAKKDEKETKQTNEDIKEEKCSCGCGDGCNCDETCDCGCQDKTIDKKLADEYLGLARQIQADFDNYRKRTIEQLSQVKYDGMAQALMVFLPVVDVLEKALKMEIDDKTKEGLNMVLGGINNSMKELGVERLVLKGKKYEPETAQAIASLNDNTMEDGVVIDEITSGYKLNNKIIRYAQVVVNKIEK